MPMARRHRVVVVGAGFGGLSATKALAKAPVDVVLVDANNYHLFQPLLYQVATAGLDADDIAYPARGIFHRQRNVDVVMGRVTGADLAARELHVEGLGPLGYDSLVLSAGAVTATFGVPGVEEHAFKLKALEDALDLRHHVLRQFEMASIDPALLDDGALTVVIVGGGPTGVELSGGLAELFTRVLAKDFKNLDVRRARVVLVEMTDRVLGTFTRRLSARALRTLRGMGVEVLLGAAVEKVEANAVHLADGRRIPARTLVWAAGVQAAGLGAQLGLEVTRGGRVVVDRQLEVPGHPDVYAIGDIAGAVDEHGTLLPQLAPVAIQAGRHVGRAIVARLEGQSARPFHYRDKGTMATIGRNNGIAQLPAHIELWGFPGWLAWLGLHLVLLIGFRNRANVLVNWAWNYLTYDRGARLIVE
jgi:NADH dehydrogenase